MSKTDHYATLQVSPSASAEEIKQAFRRLARQHHPDLNPHNPNAAQIFQQIREAYDVLSDPIRRHYYDRNSRSVSTAPATAGLDSAHRFYLEGIDCELAHHYRGALAAYSQAIEQQPLFVEALLRRCGVRYVLKQDRAVLEDSQTLLTLEANQPQFSNPVLAQIYYYQGLARLSLGYAQSALEAFGLAIAQEPDHAQAHYHLGLAHLELQEAVEGRAALDRAMALFQEQGDGEGYRRSRQKLQKNGGLHNRKWSRAARARFDPFSLLKLPVAALQAIAPVLLDPSGSLLPTYGQLGPHRAGRVGGLWLLLALGSATLAAAIQWPLGLQRFGAALLAVATLSVLGLLLGLSLVQGLRFRPQFGQGARLLFVAGATLLPLSLLMLVLAVIGTQIPLVTWSLSLWAGCYGVLILFSGLTQVMNVSESRAAIAVPLLFLFSGWLGVWSFISLIPRPALDSIQTI